MNNVKSITPNAPADFTPSLGNYKDLQPFRYWCHKILPMVYDDSLSYYELLCKVVDYLNKTMEDVETLHGDITNIRAAYEELQGYVNDYFSTLDVQEEINKKLDNMASSGELYEIIRKYTDPIVNEQNDKINVLKARMDTFASLPPGSTSGDAELTDIRVGYNGVVYPSAGDAVREQNSELKKDLDNYIFYKRLTLKDNVYIDNSGNTCDYQYKAINGFASGYFECKQDDKFIIFGYGSAGGRLWSFTDTDGNIISKANENAILKNVILVAPENAYRLVINVRTTSGTEYDNYRIIPYNDIFGKSYTYDSFSDWLNNAISILPSIISNRNATAIIKNDKLELQIWGGFYISSSINNSFSDVTITINNLSSYLALVFYVDNTDRTLKYVDWKRVYDIPMSGIVVGVWYGNRIFINGLNIVYVDDKNTTRKYSTCIFGDSITAGTGASVPYHYYSTLYGNHYNKNFGVAGSGYLTDVSSTSQKFFVGTGSIGRGTEIYPNGNNRIQRQIENYANEISDNDAIVIFAGVNDFLNNVSIENFEIGIRSCYNYVLSNFTSPFIVCTPIHRSLETNNNGNTLKQFVDKIISVCNELDIPIIDFYNNIGLHPNIDSWKSKYIPDGTHPNDLGSSLLGRYFDSKLTEYLS